MKRREKHKIGGRKGTDGRVCQELGGGGGEEVIALNNKNKERAGEYESKKYESTGGRGGIIS